MFTFDDDVTDKYVLSLTLRLQCPFLSLIYSVNSPAAGIPSRNPSMPAYQSSSFFSSESFSDGTPMGRELQRQTNVHGHTMFRDNLSHISSGSASSSSASSSSASPQSIPEKSPLESEAGALKNTDAEESPSEYIYSV